MLTRTKHFIDTYSKHAVTAAFFLGFIVDFIFLPNISNPYYPYIGILYGALVGIFILSKERQLHLLSIGRGSMRTMKVSTLVLAFVMGNFLSYVFI